MMKDTGQLNGALLRCRTVIELVTIDFRRQVQQDSNLVLQRGDEFFFCKDPYI
jgi:hypothetical protein